MRFILRPRTGHNLDRSTELDANVKKEKGKDRPGERKGRKGKAMRFVFTKNDLLSQSLPYVLARFASIHFGHRQSYL